MHRQQSFYKTRIFFRYIAGRPLDGDRRSNCTWLRDGDTALNSSGLPCKVPVTRWSMMAGWKRTAWRLGTPAAAITTTIGEIVHPTATNVTIGTTATGGTAYAAYRTQRAIRKWRHTRRVVRPLCSALAPFVEISPMGIEDRLVMGPDEIRIPLPAHHAGRTETVKDISRIVAQRTGGEWDSAINMREAPFYIRFTPTPAPPDMVTLDMVRGLVDEGTQGQPLLGLGTRGEPVRLDFEGEIAHLAASIGTGGGKSSFLRFLVAQFAYHGVRHFDVCDVKWVSLQGMEDVPGLTIHRTVDEIAQAIARFRAEMEARYRVMLKNPSKRFDRWILILEEQNAFAGLAALEWKSAGGKGQHPVFADIEMILFMARQVNMNVIAVYQRMSARASGGGELRDQYGLKLLSRFSPQAWDALVGTRPRGVSSAIPGRAIAVMGGLHRTVQVPFCRPEDALILATSGPDVTVTAPAYQQVSRCDTPTVTRYSLAEAARQDWCPITYAALRQRAHRGQSLPDREDRRYTQDEILSVIGKPSSEGVAA